MKLKLLNINKINQASIQLEGLTVIAGANDTGKSTVGKILFSLIKAIRHLNAHSDEMRRLKVQQAVRTLFLLIKRNDDRLHFLSNLFEPNSVSSFTQMMLEDVEHGNRFLQTCLTLAEEEDIPPQLKTKITKSLEKIREGIEVLTNPSQKIKRELSSIIESEFQHSVCQSGTSSSQIQLVDESYGVSLDISLENDEIMDVQASHLEDISSIDATFVESPLYIHLLNTLVNAKTLQDDDDSWLQLRPLVNYHVKDFAQKLDSFRNEVSQPVGQQPLDISAITGGKFVYHSKSSKLYWEKDGHQYVPVNVASGIKTFGVMQMLLETHHINENKILIWDEPENHLHPEWQIKFARFLVSLSKSGVPVLISSHSPYFIQAVRYFTDKEKLQKYVHYYLAEEEEIGSRIEEVTHDLNRLFLKLAEPMNQIINLGM